MTGFMHNTQYGENRGRPTPRTGLMKNNVLTSAGMQQFTPRGIPMQMNDSFDSVEQLFKTWLSGSTKGMSDLWKAWHNIDYNGNGRVSLAEIDKWLVEHYPVLDNKPAMMRAFKASCAAERDQLVHKIDFPLLLRSILYFTKLWTLFEKIDTDTDRRLNFAELRAGINKLGMLSKGKDPQDVFNQLDTNKGGLVLFDEFCKWVASVDCPISSNVYDPSAMAGRGQHKAEGVNDLMLQNVAYGGQSGQRSLQPARGVANQRGPGGVFNSAKFGELEARFKALVRDKKQLQGLWRRIDYNGNGIVSLAEIDKLVVEAFPELDNKPALMRAYKATTRAGDSYVQKHEFIKLLRNLVYFNKLWGEYDMIDADNDRRLTFAEFQKGASRLQIMMSLSDAKDEFDFMDENGGGMILFDEFCKWAAGKKLPVD